MAVTIIRTVRSPRHCVKGCERNAVGPSEYSWSMVSDRAVCHTVMVYSDTGQLGY